MAIPAILSDNPVTQFQVSGPPMVDGQNLYTPSMEYSDPVTGNNAVTAAKLHIFKSADNGVTWGEQDAAHAPSVYSAISAVYGSPPTPPFLIIDTIKFFPVVPGYTGPQVIPFATAVGSIDPSTGYDTGNDTLQINLLEFGFLIQGVTLVVDGIWGNPGDARSIAAPLAAALNAQLVMLGIAPSVMSIGVGAGAIPFNHTGFSELVDNSSMVVLTTFTGHNWALSVTGNMVNAPYIPPIIGRTSLHIAEVVPASASTIYTTYGVDANLNPIPVCFNTYAATYRNHVIYLAYVATDQTLTVGRYNTLTDTWMSPISGGPALSMLVYDPSFGVAIACSLQASIQVRSTGAIVIAYAVGSNQGTITATQFFTSWVVYSGGWGSPAQITSAYQNNPTISGNPGLGGALNSVIDSSDNAVFFLGTPFTTAIDATHLFIAAFVVKHDNTTVAPYAIDPTPNANAVGRAAAFISAGNRVIVVISFASPSDSTYTHAYMLEATSATILAAGSWTIFRSPDYLNGSFQYGGGTSAQFWANQFRLILAQSVAAGSDGAGTLWNTNVSLATGNGTGGAADTAWGASAAALAFNAVSGVLNREIYSAQAVVLADGNLGVLYSFVNYVPQPTNYFSRFVVFGALVASCNSPSSGSVGGPYAHTFTATGGNPPYTWSVASGSLPAGLTLNPASGVLSGIPTAVASYSFSLLVTDYNGNTATISCSIAVSGPFTASCGTITGGSTVGTSFTQTLAETGGSAAYTWSLLMGALPAGTTLAPSTGVISGTLTTPGRYFYTVKVTDSTGNFAFVSCFVQICPAS